MSFFSYVLQLVAYLIIGLLLISKQAVSQGINLEKITFLEDNFEKVKYSSVDEADVDNDGDIDIVITGTNSSSQTKTILYINEGEGKFTPSTNSFIGVCWGSVEFGDIDNDNDQDLLITGNGYVRFYINNGLGHFTVQSSPYITGVVYSSSAFGDVDSDGDIDLMIASQTSTKLYKNNGEGRFVEFDATAFPDAQNGSVNFADFDNDNDLDLIITGYLQNGFPNTDIYINDGSGIFSKDFGASLTDVGASDVSVDDIDGDGDNDILLSGSSGASICKLYINDGLGNFTQLDNTPFLGVKSSTSDIVDLDNDGDKDVLISGRYYNYVYGKTKAYLNDGNEVFTELTSVGFNGIVDGDIALCDMDGDNDTDILLTGFCDANFYTNMYFNEGSSDFEEVGFELNPVRNASSDFADIDGDGDKDMIICGNTGSYSSSCSTSLYKNVGNRNFVLLHETGLKDLGNAKVCFADIDNDNDQDIFLMGDDEYNTRYSLLYKNDGNGLFTQVQATNLVPMRNGDAIFFDANNDGALDLFTTGHSAIYGNTSILYFNDGSGNFQGMSSDFVYSNNATVSCADVDNDGDIDLFLSGYNSKSRLYLNLNNGNFISSPHIDFPKLSYGDSEFSDIDNDGDSDLIIMGEIVGSAYVFKNDGEGIFEYVASISTPELTYASIDVSDIDKDGDVDLLISGKKSYGQYETKLFENIGYGTFEEVQDVDFPGLYNADVKFADIDGDTDEDLLLVGQADEGNLIEMYENLCIVGIEEQTGEELLRIYPNPLKQNSRIVLNKIYRNAVLQIYDMKGELVYTEKMNQTNTTSNITLTKGLYILQLREVNGNLTNGKIIVE